MVVRTKLCLISTLLCVVAGCAGNVVVGVPRDGGDDIIDEPVGKTDDGGVTKGPSTLDAAVGSGRKDSGTPVVEDPDEPEPSEPDVEDAGEPAEPPPEPGNASPTPTGAGRDLSTDKAKFLGAPRCSDKVLFCDEFEQTVGNPPGPAYSYPFGAMPKIDSTRAARGTRAMRFDVTAGTPNLVELKNALPAMNNTVFGRMFVWIDALPSAPNGARWTLVGGSGAGNNAEVRLGATLVDGKALYGIGSDGGDTGDWFTSGKEPGSTVVRGGWTCLEWMFKGDSSETRVWVDGVEQTSLHLTQSEYREGDADTGKPFRHPSVDKLRVGYWLYSGEVTPNTTSVWIDSLYYDDDRIGCVL